MKQLGQRLMARDFDRQVAEFQVSVAVPNGFTALGIPVTKVVGQLCPPEGTVRPSDDLRNRARENRYRMRWNKVTQSGPTEPFFAWPNA